MGRFVHVHRYDTVHHRAVRDIPRLGSRAVPMLFKQIDGEKVSNATESACELMVRDSVAPPPVDGE